MKNNRLDQKNMKPKDPQDEKPPEVPCTSDPALGSIGLVLALRDMSGVCEDAKGNRVWVKHVTKGSPAEKESRIKVGDEILEIGKEDPVKVRKLAEEKRLDLIAKAISGRVGSECYLLLYNYERKEEYSVTLERMEPTRFDKEEEETADEDETPSILMLFLYPFEVVSLLGLIGFCLIRLPNFLALLPESFLIKYSAYLTMQWTSPTIMLMATMYLLHIVMSKPASRTLSGLIILELFITLFVFFSVVLFDYELLWRPPAQVKQALRGRVAVVVNGYEQIGLEVTKYLQESGASIILGCLDEDACLPILQELASSSSSSRWSWTVESLPLDFCSLRSIRAFGSQISSKYGRMDYVVVGKSVHKCDADDKQALTDTPRAFLRLYNLMDSLKPAILHSTEEATRVVAVSNQMHWLSLLSGRTGTQANMFNLLDYWVPHLAGHQPDDALSELLFLKEYAKQTRADPSFRNKQLVVRAVGLGCAGTKVVSELEAMDSQMSRSSEGSVAVRQVLRALVLACRSSSLAANLVLFALFAPDLSSEPAGFIDTQGYEVGWHPGSYWRGVNVEELATAWWRSAESFQLPSPSESS